MDELEQVVRNWDAALYGRLLARKLRRFNEAKAKRLISEAIAILEEALAEAGDID